MKVIEQALRIAAYSAVLCFVLLRGYQTIQQDGSRVDPRGRAQALVGKHLSLPGADIKMTRATAVLVMSTTCPFCTASAPFYHRLTTDVALSLNGNFETVAVLPEDASAAQTYATQTLGANFDVIRQGSIDGALVTPTLFLLDSAGIVKQVWVGKLDSAAEDQVVAAVRRTTATTSN
jgi:hypothetical protein